MLRKTIQSRECQVPGAQGNQRAVFGSQKNQILLIISYNETLSLDKAAISPYGTVLQTGENISFFILVLFVRNLQ